ncbi:MAG: response regulator [Anaerolineales bacterium]
MTKVLLIEDDATMISLLETLLEIEGFEVKKIDDYDTVLDDAKAEIPDIVLMDIHLGEANGLEILQEMREDPDYQSVKVIMSSGMDYSSQSMKAGANDFIMKPYMPDELLDKIQQLTGRGA